MLWFLLFLRTTILVYWVKIKFHILTHLFVRFKVDKSIINLYSIRLRYMALHLMTTYITLIVENSVKTKQIYFLVNNLTLLSQSFGMITKFWNMFLYFLKCLSLNEFLFFFYNFVTILVWINQTPFWKTIFSNSE